MKIGISVDFDGDTDFNGKRISTPTSLLSVLILSSKLLTAKPSWSPGAIFVTYPAAVSFKYATVRTGHGTTDWFQIKKGVCQGCILSPCLFNFYEEYIIQNARLDEAQAGIKISGRNINNLRYPDDTTLMAESKEELKIPLMKVKDENEKVGLKLNVRNLRSWHPVPSLHGK